MTAPRRERLVNSDVQGGGERYRVGAVQHVVTAAAVCATAFRVCPPGHAQSRRASWLLIQLPSLS